MASFRRSADESRIISSICTAMRLLLIDSLRLNACTACGVRSRRPHVNRPATAASLSFPSLNSCPAKFLGARPTPS
jgi:hypothetical protein